MRYGPFALAVIVATLVLAPSAAWSRTAAPSATGVIAGSGTAYTLTITNTGNETIRCMLLAAPAAVRITGANGTGQVVFQGNRFGSVGFSLPPGQSATWNFTTEGPYPPNAGGALSISSDCIGDVSTRATGPAPPEPCRCTTLEGRIVPSTLKFTNPGDRGGMHLEFAVTWTMTCTAGAGACRGQLELDPPQPALKLKTRLKPISGRIACNGPCAATSGGSKKFVLFGGRELGGDRRGKTIKQIKLRMKRTCQGVRARDRVFTLVFTRNTALIDKKKSDLNPTGPG